MLLTKNTTNIFKLAKIGLIITTFGCIAGYTGKQWNNDGYTYGALIQKQNDALNKGGSLWHKDNKIINGTMTIIDGTGTVFMNVPSGISNKELIAHYSKKASYRNHKFYPDAYVTIQWDDLNDDNRSNDVKKWTSYVGTDKGCVPFQYYLTNNMWDARMNGIEKTRKEYISACGWNDYVDMSFSVPKNIMLKYQASDYLQLGWFGLLSLLLCVPAIWILFFRVLGVAYRSAYNEIKGGKK